MVWALGATAGSLQSNVKLGLHRVVYSWASKEEGTVGPPWSNVQPGRSLWSKVQTVVLSTQDKIGPPMGGFRAINNTWPLVK